MRQSPGHRKWPDHEVREEPVEGTLQVEVEGEIVAESSAALRVVEDGSPPRDYFPRSDVHMDKLEARVAFDAEKIPEIEIRRGR